MKVPVIVAALAAGQANWDAIEAAITRSDNEAALRLWRRLDDGSAEVEAVLRARRRRPHDASSASRTHAATAPSAAPSGRCARRSTFYAALARGELLPAADTERVLDAMGRIVPEQRWGLGRVPGIRFKGGWGPSERPEGGYEVIQVGIAGARVIAVAARAEDFEGRGAVASKHVPQHPNTP